MGILNMLFSFKGRVSRAQFWLINTLSSVFVGIAMLAAGTMLFAGYWNGERVQMAGAMTGSGLLIVPAVAAAMWSGSAAAVKRLHDRDKSSWWLTAFSAPMMIFVAVAVTSGLLEALKFQQSVPMQLLSAIAMVWFAVELGCLAGTPGPNRFDTAPVSRADQDDQLAGKHLDGAWAGRSIEDMIERARDAAPLPRRSAVRRAEKRQGFGRRGLRT